MIFFVDSRHSRHNTKRVNGNKANDINTDMKLTNTQTEILSKEILVKEQVRGEMIRVISLYGSSQHRSMRSLEDKGLVSLAPIQPYLNTFVFATRKGQEAGIGQELSLNYEERTEKKITLNKNDRFTLVEALKGYKPRFDPSNRVAKLIERLSA